MLNIFQYDDYKTVLREALLQKKSQHGSAFTFEKMAKACRVQRTYLSTVLKGKGHLNSDQLYVSSEFLKFTELEYKFLVLLHDRDRSVFPKRVKILNKEISQLRQAELRTESTISVAVTAETRTETDLTNYYLDFNAQILHMFLTIEFYRCNTGRICKSLGWDSRLLDTLLKKLEDAKLITLKNDRIEVLQNSLHLPAKSPLFPAYRAHMRLQALAKIQHISAEAQYTFSALFTADNETRRKIQVRFLEFLNWAQKVSEESKNTQVCQINFDLLAWSD